MMPLNSQRCTEQPVVYRGGKNVFWTIVCARRDDEGLWKPISHRTFQILRSHLRLTVLASLWAQLWEDDHKA